MQHLPIRWKAKHKSNAIFLVIFWGLLGSWKLDMSNDDLIGCFVLSVIVIFDWAWLEDKKKQD